MGRFGSWVAGLALLLTGGGWSGPLPADDGTGDGSLEGMTRVVVPDAELARLRGGLIRGDGFEVTLGIERLTAINGEVVARTVLRDAAGHAMVPDALDGVQVRNTLDGLRIASMTDNPGATVLQNTLDRQILSNMTRMDVGLRGMNLSRTELNRLLDAEIIQGLRGY